jgi:enhancing lycopene biosynthesis protein 2
MTKVGVVLSGCGFLDGSEIHEAVLTLYFLDRAGAEVRCFAPDAPQRDVVDHRAKKPTGEKRNALVEAARIARGKIEDLAKARAQDLDAVILPGGYGAAKNLCDFAVNGANAVANDAVAKLLRDVHAAKKPIGAICIAPAVVAATFKGGATHPTLTIGSDAGTAAALESMGARHAACPVNDFRVDEANLIVSAPAYMYDARIAEVAAGIEKLVAKVLELAKKPARVSAAR